MFVRSSTLTPTTSILATRAPPTARLFWVLLSLHTASISEFDISADLC